MIDLKEIARILEDEWKLDAKERGVFRVWNEKFTKPITKNYKISLCTTCMNRLKDVQQTLPKNINDNLDYENIEFVLVDYNSKDGLGEWVRSEMMHHIKSGKLVYFRTEEPRFYTMSHSRNVAFKIASGDIVNNIDADSYVNQNFAYFVNRLANEQPRKAMFGKSKQLLRGRLGFFRGEFLSTIGGYDETLTDYGHDDADLMHRAWELGFVFMPYRGPYYGCVKEHTKHLTDNMREKRWWYSEGRNRIISFSNLITGQFKANRGKRWGRAKGIRNFNEEIAI